MSDVIEVPVVQEQRPDVVVGKSFKNRALSYILDAVFVNIISFIIQFIVALIIGVIIILMGNTNPTQDETALRCVSVLFALINSLLYFISFETLYGATPGKLILGTRVVMEDGSACTFKAALIRGLYRYIDGLFCGVIALIKMQMPWYQRYGDLRAHTIVVDKKESFIKTNNPLWKLFLALAIYMVAVGIGNAIAQLATIQ